MPDTLRIFEQRKEVPKPLCFLRILELLKVTPRGIEPLIPA